MYHDLEKLLTFLSDHNALIVHCSRKGKGNGDRNVLPYSERYFPDDMLHAIDLCDTQSTEICCSVIWPGHTETFGDIGIVVKPRSIQAITKICVTDAGSSVDTVTGRRVSAGVEFSHKAVIETFGSSKGYNEWLINNADTIGIFVKSVAHSPQVGYLRDCTQDKDYVPGIYPEFFADIRDVEFSEIYEKFAGLPVFTMTDNGVLEISPRIVSPYAR